MSFISKLKNCKDDAQALSLLMRSNNALEVDGAYTKLYEKYPNISLARRVANELMGEKHIVGALFIDGYGDGTEFYNHVANNNDSSIPVVVIAIHLRTMNKYDKGL
jgi:hypothetical protein